MLGDFAGTAEEIATTTKKSVKERLLAAYLSKLDDADLERAVVFFSGGPFPNREEKVTGVGWATIADAVSETLGMSYDELGSATFHHGDLGDGLADIFAKRGRVSSGVTLLELADTFDELAATSGSTNKRKILTRILQKLDHSEVRFVAKILLGEFRIGLQEGLVESAIAKAFDQPLKGVRRAHMLSGDLGATALLARSGTLESARMNLFQPIALMLAQPEENPARIIEQLGEGALADDKYDGIRAQIHTDGEEVRIYSRTLDQITHRFPELESEARRIGRAAVLDGEIVAFNGRILPFALLQTRLGRRKISEKLLADAPVAFFAFDLLYLDGDALFEVPLRERLAKLATIVEDSGLIRPSFQRTVSMAADVDEAFDASRVRANEGLVVKDPNSYYTPGRRGKSWLKYKKALATLDCVITAAEYGHGKRRSVLSDYTFAVRRDGELVNIGKAYSGLTDVEIDQLTGRLKEITTATYGPVHVVSPEIVLEIAFDRIQESSRHKSGYALRFPRIANLRADKSVDDISTIDEVRRIYEGQMQREGGVS